MTFKTTYDDVLYLYPYYSFSEKSDEKSKEVYQVFKKNWGVKRFLPDIYNDLSEAISDFFVRNRMNNLKVAVTVMPSHSKGMYGESLLQMAHNLARDFRFLDASNLIQRTIDKQKSTEGGARNVDAHLQTLGLSSELNDVDVYIILDDITTTGSSLEAAKALLMANGVNANNIIKIAVSKTMHDDND